MSRAFWTTLFVFALLLAPVCVQAAPTSIVDDIEAYSETEDSEENELFEEALEVMEEADEDMSEEELLDMDILQITKGFTKAVDPTFDAKRNIGAQGEEGTQVAIFVYEETDDDEVQLLFSTDLCDIGASGQYGESIRFPEIGTNYVLIYVKKDDYIQARRFTIIRKEKEVKENLENLKSTVGTQDKDQKPKVDINLAIDGDGDGE